MKTKNIILSVIMAFVFGWVCNYTFCPRKCVSERFTEKLLVDTQYVIINDTMPVVKTEYLTKNVYVPVYVDSGNVDSIPLPVVQRTYTDDSTYTAYVSGVQVDSFPRLDSISIRQRNIVIYHEVERTIIKNKPFSIGVQTGVGYGILSRKPDIYIGIGMQFSF